jgi:3-methyladenine DNA glycosylase AlkD
LLKETVEIIDQLRSLANADNVAGMARYGISSEGTLGISIYTLRPMAKEICIKHEDLRHNIALELWESGIHEGKILASFIEVPSLVTEQQMDDWVKDFDSWDVCDQVCTSLFDQTPFAYPKAYEWSECEEEFVKRAGFVLMAGLAVHDKDASNEKLAGFFAVIEREAWDGRNFVKKAVNWALRNIGKRNKHLNLLAVETARRLCERDNPSARWIGRDAVRELTSEKVQKRLDKIPPAK